MDSLFNKYRAAIEVLQKGRNALVETMAEEILAQGDDLIEGGFLFNEFLESQGTRLHFLCLMLGQLEQSAEALDEQLTAPPPPPPAEPRTPRRSRSRSKKAQQKVSTEAEGAPEDL
ncbi:MAG: hypothetical protein U0835_14495 [Isosphaeraceae bacterium]